MTMQCYSMDQKHGKHAENTYQNTNLYQEMPAQNSTHDMARLGTDHYTLGTNQTITNNKGNIEENLGWTDTHSEETTAYIIIHTIVWNSRRRGRPRNTRQ